MTEYWEILTKLWPIVVSIFVFGIMVWKNQKLILARLDTFDKKFEDHEEDIKNLYTHKDNELKYRIEAEGKFLTHTTHKELHQK